MTDELKEAIREIITNVIPKGCIFDSHCIIEILIQEHDEVYSNASTNYQDTTSYHAQIGRTIDAIVNDLDYTRLSGDAWSKNTHGNFSRCTAYKTPDA